MNGVHLAIDVAISETEALLKILKKNIARQVRAAEEKSIIKATVLAWFNNHRVAVITAFDDNALSEIDQLYRQALSSSQRATLRSDYISKLKKIKGYLIELGSQSIIRPATASQRTPDQPPGFAPLISDPNMQTIMSRRWEECIRCIAANAPLAAIVMMGGLIEAILLARINHESNKAPIFKASGAPKDRTTGQTLPLKDWSLKNYIDVAHELGWISQSAKDVGEVLRDYRNYIHPYKELSHGVALNTQDAAILWEIGKNISRQIIDSV